MEIALILSVVGAVLLLINWFNNRRLKKKGDAEWRAFLNERIYEHNDPDPD